MSYGLGVYTEQGVTSYSTDDVTWNQVDFFFVPGGGYAQNNYPVLRGREVLVVQIMIDAPPLDRRAIAHSIDVASTLVTASGGSENAYILVLMR